MSFWDYFSQSVILQGFLTVALWASAVYLIVIGRDVPDLLAAACGMMITFWFASKTAAETARKLNEP